MSLPPPQFPPPDPQRDLPDSESQRAERHRRSNDERAARREPRVPFEFRRPSPRFRNAPPFVVSNALIAINVGIFVWMTLGEVGSVMFGSAESDRTMSFVISRIFLEQGEWYRLISCGFVHFGVIHVGFNMLLLYQLGRLIEPVIGPLRFGLLYFAALLGGSLGALLLSPDAATGGASGAVFGLMAASVVGVGQRGVNPLRTGLGVTFAINVLFTLAVPGVSVGGHFGGAAIGALVGALTLAPRSWRVPAWASVAVPLAVSAACVAIAVAFVQG
ncbi:MAG: rhomboid family intramembrane serine protease [Actinomycetota bacterium]